MRAAPVRQQRCAPPRCAPSRCAVAWARTGARWLSFSRDFTRLKLTSGGSGRHPLPVVPARRGDHASMGDCLPMRRSISRGFMRVGLSGPVLAACLRSFRRTGSGPECGPEDMRWLHIHAPAPEHEPGIAALCVASLSRGCQDALVSIRAPLCLSWRRHMAGHPCYPEQWSRPCRQAPNRYRQRHLPCPRKSGPRSGMCRP